MANKSAGIILYPEDIARIKRSVKPQYQFAVIWALSQYATDGVMPTEDDLGEGGMVAFEFIIEKVRDALDAYKRGQQQRQEAIRKRWNKDEHEQIRDNTTVYDRIEPNNSVTKTENRNRNINIKTKTVDEENKRNSNLKHTTPAAEVIAFDGSDLTEDIRRNNIADDMIADYNLSRDRVTRSALLEDIETHGESRMREVLTKACQSNTRDKVTVNYWRAILNGKGRDSQKKDSGVGYGEVLCQREYSPDYWKSIEVNLDE